MRDWRHYPMWWRQIGCQRESRRRKSKNYVMKSILNMTVVHACNRSKEFAFFLKWQKLINEKSESIEQFLTKQQNICIVIRTMTH